MGGHDALLWLYGANAVFLTVHEIDSAYWREWRLLQLPGGLALSLVFSVAAVALHGALLARGHPEFRAAASLTVLAAILVASLAQGALTLTLL